MSLLRQLARVTARAVNRVAGRLLAWAGEAPAVGAEPDAVDFAVVEPDDGPPAHWVETVRSKAPWLLTGARWPRPESPVRRLPVTRPNPEQKPAPSRLQAPRDPRPNVVYKEGDRLNATRKREDRSPLEPVQSRVANDPPEPASPEPDPAAPKRRQGRTAPSSAIVEPELEPQGRVASGGQENLLPSPGPREARGFARQQSPTLSAPPATPPSTGPVRYVQTGASMSSPRKREARHPSTTAPVRLAPPRSVARSVDLPPTSLDGSRPTEPAAISHARRRSAPPFLSAVWNGLAREYPKTQTDVVEDEATGTDDLWPQLPEWGWQQWQVDPIQRQLQEWNRRSRLMAEQAGSSWSGRLF
jgi:hypothetical protein